jgi:hypothetical protein
LSALIELSGIQAFLRFVKPDNRRAPAALSSRADQAPAAAGSAYVGQRKRRLAIRQAAMFAGAYRRLFPVDASGARGQGSARKRRRTAAPLCDAAKPCAPKRRKRRRR